MTIAALLALASCAPRAAIEVSESFARRATADAVLLPVIDARISKTGHVVVPRYTGDAAERVLENKGYMVERLSGLSADVERAEFTLTEMSAEELARLAPGNARFAVFISLDEFRREGEAGQLVYRAKLSGVAVDPSGPTILWRDTASAESGLTGALAVFAGGSASYAASYAAVRSLLATMPDAPQ